MTRENLLKLRKSKIIAALRRVSRWWAPRTEAMKLAKVSPGKYKCQSCGDIVGQKEIKMDHKAAVVDPKHGFQTWEIYIERMFCDVEGFDAICENCHIIKTQTELELRKQYRAIRKKATKK